MKFLSVVAILVVSSLTVDAYLYDINLSIFNFETTEPIKGQLTATVVGEKTNIDLEFDESYFYKHKNLRLKFELPDQESINEIVLKFDEEENLNNKFVVGPIVISLLNKSEFQVFQPENRFISENNNVSYKKI